MLQKTRGIVINYTKYRDSSIITRIYTEELGLQSYIVNGIRSPRARNRMALYQPLTLLDLVVYYKKERQKINRISEARCYYPFISIPFDFKKAGIALFLTEMLGKCLREEAPHYDLFQFLINSIVYLDQASEHTDNFHLHFLLRLCSYLGFNPGSGAEMLTQIGEYKKILLEPPDLLSLEKAIDCFLNDTKPEAIYLSGRLRSEAIDLILDFYQLHVDNLTPPKSLGVLREMNH